MARIHIRITQIILTAININGLRGLTDCGLPAWNRLVWFVLLLQGLVYAGKGPFNELMPLKGGR